MFALLLGLATLAYPCPVGACSVAAEGERVYALGYLEPAAQIRQLAAPTSLEGSRIEALLVNQGDWVTLNQVVAILDNRSRLEAALTAAEAGLTVAQAQLAQVEAGASVQDIVAQEARIRQLEAQQQANTEAQLAIVNRLQAVLVDAQRNKQRFEALFREGAVSANDLEQRELAYTSAVDVLQEAETQLSLIERTRAPELTEARAILARLQEVREVDRAVAAAAVTAAEARRQQAEASLEQAFIRAPLEAQVIDIHARPGELVGPLGIVELAETNKMQVVAEVHESDIAKVEVGHQAIISGPALPIALEGSVESVGLRVARQTVVNANPAANIDARVIEVRIDLAPESAALVTSFSNMQVDVEILANP